MIETSLLALHRHQQLPLIEAQDSLWVARFTDPLEEYRAVQTRVGLLDGSALGILELTGRDRATFLHGLVTNDIKALPEDRACWACALSPKGRVESLCLIVHRAASHWVIAPRWLLPRVRALLDRYLIMEDVRIADQSAAWTILGLQGPATPQCVSRLARTTVTCADQQWTTVTLEHYAIGVLGHEPLGVPGVLCVVPSERAVQVWEDCRNAGATPVGLFALHMLRVEAGVPWYGVDVDETCLLPETGWERLATSYTKGCYVGQEIVARVASRGQVNRHLVGLKFSTQEPPSPPCELRLDDQPCGAITSAAHSPKFQTAVGLGLVSRRAWTPGVQLEVRGPQGATAQLVALPQLPLPVQSIVGSG